MPGGDRRGPSGFGPMTGRGAGFCAGYNMPGYMNPAVGGGFRGGGFGRGGGRGFGRGYGAGGYRGGSRFFGAGFPAGMGQGYYGADAAPQYVVPPMAEITKDQEMEYLAGQADYLKQGLESITKRINELKKKNSKG